jgi:hypothetical protein
MTSLAQQPQPEAAAAVSRIALVALLSVALGFVMQGAVIGLTLWGGGLAGSALASAAGGVSWAVLVCTGLGVATLLTRGRPLLAGLLAALIAPTSLALAKACQKVVAGWLGAAQSQAVLSLGTVSLLRAVEYGLLGWLLGRLVARGKERAAPYLAAGVLTGVVFGGAITVLNWYAASVAGTPLTAAKLASTVVNEMVFPVGCAVVIYLGLAVRRSLNLAGLAERQDA